EAERARLVEFSSAVESAKQHKDAALTALANAGTPDDARGASALAAEAGELMRLVKLGRPLGLRDGHCPPFDTEHSQETYERGIATAEAIARRLDEHAARGQNARPHGAHSIPDCPRRNALWMLLRRHGWPRQGLLRHLINNGKHKAFERRLAIKSRRVRPSFVKGSTRLKRTFE